MTVIDVFQFINDIGLVGVAALIIWGGLKRKWVFGWTHEEVKTDLRQQLDRIAQDRDDWRALALKGTEFAERFATQFAEDTEGGG
ncbi:hypothetical protein LCGC14_0987220 [marine sediment metagenome]|uniref:Uncharacterized protein n=1 Tax=marine sediment metagenome TaxID=412755 RepID=A0A0F9RDJ4_9ZZZZ